MWLSSEMVGVSAMDWNQSALPLELCRHVGEGIRTGSSAANSRLEVGGMSGSSIA